MPSGGEGRLFYFDWEIPSDGFLWNHSAETVTTNQISNLSLSSDLKRKPKRKTAADVSAVLPTDSPPFLVINPKSKEKIRYKPLEQYPDLYLSFASLQGTEEDVLDFANKYGWLGKPQWIFNRQNRGILGESLHVWRHQIEEMQMLRQVNDWVQNHKTQILKKMIFWSKDGNRVEFSYRTKTETFGSTTKIYYMVLADKNQLIHPEYLARWTPNDVLEPTKVFLASRINMALTDTRWNLLLNEENKIVPYIRPSSLLNALWWQFAQCVTGQRRLVTCQICNEWMDVTDFRRSKKVHNRCSKLNRQKNWLERKSKNGQKKRKG